MNPAERLCESPSRFAPHKARPGPDHGMAPTHNVDIADEFSNLRMRLREVVENEIRPGFPDRCSAVERVHSSAMNPPADSRT